MVFIILGRVTARLATLGFSFAFFCLCSLWRLGGCCTCVRGHWLRRHSGCGREAGVQALDPPWERLCFRCSILCGACTSFFELRLTQAIPQ